MSNRHPIDDLFRQGVGLGNHPFRDSYWLEAEQLILAEEKRRKKYLLSLLSYALLLVTVVSIPLLVWIFSSNPLFSELPPLNHQLNTVSLLHPPEIPKGERLLPGEENSMPFNGFLSLTQKEEEGVGEYQDAEEFGKRTEMDVTDFPHRSSYLTSMSGTQTRDPFRFLYLANPRFEGTLLSGLQSGIPSLAVPKSGYSRHDLSLRLGFNLLPSYQGLGSPLNEWSASPSLGIRYAYSLSPRLKLFSGLFYQARGGLNADTTIRVVEYGFGADVQSTIISPQRLHYVEVPLGIDLRFHKNHYLLAGAQLNYLINATGSESSLSENSFGVKQEEESLSWGYTQGFRQWNTNLMAGYAWYWQRGIRLGAMAHYDLQNPQDASFFTDRELASRLQLRFFVEVHLSHF